MGGADGTGAGVGAWSHDNQGYILLPYQCLLAPGTTGDAGCTAYGVGWAYRGRLENNTDLLSGRVEVRGDVEPFGSGDHGWRVAKQQVVFFWGFSNLCSSVSPHSFDSAKGRRRVWYQLRVSVTQVEDELTASVLAWCLVCRQVAQQYVFAFLFPYSRSEVEH